MSVEAVLIFMVSSLVMLLLFLGDNGPVSTFKDAGPRLAVKIERSLSIGHDFVFNGTRGQDWK